MRVRKNIGERGETYFSKIAVKLPPSHVPTAPSIAQKLLIVNSFLEVCKEVDMKGVMLQRKEEETGEEIRRKIDNIEASRDFPNSICSQEPLS